MIVLETIADRCIIIIDSGQNISINDSHITGKVMRIIFTVRQQKSVILYYKLKERKPSRYLKKP